MSPPFSFLDPDGRPAGDSVDLCQHIAVSQMIFVDGGSVLATAASGITGLNDLAGKRVGVIAHSTTQQALAQALTRQEIQARVIALADHGEGIQGLESGRQALVARDSLGERLGLRGGARLGILDGQQMIVGGDVLLAVQGVSVATKGPWSRPSRRWRC